MAEKHLHEQIRFTREYLVPYFEKHLPGFRRMRVLDIGCAEAGFLSVLHEMGVETVGVELERERVVRALSANHELIIIQGDITDESIVRKIPGRFDLIVLRDVIEHIPPRERLMSIIRQLLRPGGFVFISFPPRFSPFGGHQQNGRSLLRYVPYLQLWPPFLIRLAGRIFHESPKLVDHVIHNFRTGLSIRRFSRLCRESGFAPLIWQIFLVRPIYRQRFGLRARPAPDLTLVREVVASGCETLLQLNP